MSEIEIKLVPISLSAHGNDYRPGCTFYATNGVSLIVFSSTEPASLFCLSDPHRKPVQCTRMLELCPLIFSTMKGSKSQVPPRFELGSLDSKSRVLTITPWNPGYNPL